MIKFRKMYVAATISVAALLYSPSAFAQSMAFKQALAQTVSADKEVSSFYQSRDYSPVWTAGGSIGRNRVKALVAAFKNSGAHGLPANDYDADALQSMIRAARSDEERGALEGKLSRIFLQYARDVQTGIVNPSQVDSEIFRKVPYRGRQATLVAFTKTSPDGFMRALPPKTVEYARLMKEKMRFERLLASGGWGPQVPANSLKPGATGNSVVMLRNRLSAMGFLGRTTTVTYDANIQSAVQQFQLAHGLKPDGVAGSGTMKQINLTVAYRLQSIIVAMERERWMNRPRGQRHVWVNIPDFTAQVRDDNRVTFETRSVVGKNVRDNRSPEFSDMMEFMVINPTWYVPRSITVREYLPLLKSNPNAAGHLQMQDSRGNNVSRSEVDFSSYNEDNFPYSFRQPPSGRNALGLVKFMFPNRHNIYLHDTQAKSLFSRERRAFSHGCIRLRDPFDFAYALLAKQTDDPAGLFQSRLRSKNESRLNLQQPVPVHIVYRTAFTQADKRIQFRRDVYGRDRKIWSALQRQGVTLRAVGG